jgi:carbamoyl-phosphate synthase, small subunit
METTYLLLSDGTRFAGRGFGCEAPLISDAGISIPAGELVFNTSMTGYGKILTDPSYNGQLVLMTYPLIGNYGIDISKSESDGIKAVALIVKKLYRGSVPEGRETLDAAMKRAKVPGLEGIDTRALTLHLREHGSQNALLYRGEDHEMAKAVLAAFPAITERDLITSVSAGEKTVNPKLGAGFPLPPNNAKKSIALLDFGVKKSIIAGFYKRGIAVTLLPPTTTGEEILALKADALFLSNGPGDPALLSDAVEEIRKVLGKMPVLGICLGHQLITIALGGKTVKMKYGHHGANHPVKDTETGRIFVTAQNHGFMSDKASLPDTAKVWFVNANDGSVEGLKCASPRTVSVQFHPEACPGPLEADYIFDEFAKEIL